VSPIERRTARAEPLPQPEPLNPLPSASSKCSICSLLEKEGDDGGENPDSSERPAAIGVAALLATIPSG